MRTTILLTGLMLLSLVGLAQNGVNYNDVAVIVNDNSNVSLEIGAYFQEQRKIPDENMIHISSTTDEEINLATFNDIAGQIETCLLSKSLSNSINYLVTTKGVPLKVKVGELNEEDFSSYLSSAAFESELCAFLSSSSRDKIGKSSFVKNPYFLKDCSFSREEFDIFLVSRLDGYTKEDVIGLIDRSGPDIKVDMISVLSVFDINDVDDGDNLEAAEMKMNSTVSCFEDNGWPVIYDKDIDILQEQENVLLYSCANLVNYNKVVNNAWNDGSVAEILGMFSACTFEKGSNDNNVFLVADLINEGVGAGIGYVYIPYIQTSFLNKEFFKSYLESDNQYNLAESYYKAVMHLSWISVLIGDPKTSIIVEDIEASTMEENLSGSVKIFPNPVSNVVFIKVENTLVNSVSVYNTAGQLLKSKISYDSLNQCSVDLSMLSKGLYLIKVVTAKGGVSKRVLVK